MLNDTHRPELRSWIESANRPDVDFPVQNLPYGVFRARGSEAPWRIGTAIGDEILDLAEVARHGLLAGDAARAVATCTSTSLNGLMSLGPVYWSALREQLSGLLRAGSSAEQFLRGHRQAFFVPLDDAELRVAADIGDYTDFYASVYHATNVGSMLRPDNPLLANYKWVPIGYHGRASSIVRSGTPVRRPSGQSMAEGATVPSMGPSQRVDYEAELGFFVGEGTTLGNPIAIAEAPRHLFGVCLLNDWSARDIQAWEYQPLGPFLAKNFATTLSPWVVTWEALAPFRTRAFARDPHDPAPLPYLTDPGDQHHGGLDLSIEVYLRTARMRAIGEPAARVSRSNASDLYWTAAQLLTHHASNGCNLQPGDLLGSGTVSGPTKESRGCLLELTWRGTEPFVLPNGEERRFLEDGDEVILRAHCAREGFVRIGFGECVGTIQPA
jgi:fumarylacetoacetase